MIDLKNIHYKANNFFLDKINHTFEEKKIHIILGPSGSGKTLLLEIIAGLRTPQNGQIIYHNTDITKLLPEKRNIAYLPQDNVLFPHLNVKENISYALKIKGINNDANSLKITEKLQITPILNRNVQHLSGGEIQRVALARSIIAGSKTLLLDEPTSAFHYSLKNEFLHFLKEIQKDYELTIIMVTHDILGVFSIADYITFLINGKLYQTFNNTEPKFTPTHYEVAKFMGIKNIFEGYISSHDKIICPHLNTAFTIHPTLPDKKNMNIKFGIKPEDIRIILPEKKKNYTNTPNQLKGNIKKIYRHFYHYNLLFVPHNIEYPIEIHFPITKSEKITLYEGKDIEIIIKPNDIFLLI